MNSSFCIAAAVLVFSGSSTLHAQLAPREIAQGTRIRFAQTDAPLREGFLARRLSVTLSDTIVLNSTVGLTERIPVASLIKLQLLKQSSWTSHIGIGFLVGTVLGTGVGLAAGQGRGLSSENPRGANATGFAVVGGVLGGFLGGTVGALFGPRANWVDVPLPGK